jgi:hypothetical protein
MQKQPRHGPKILQEQIKENNYPPEICHGA